MTRALQIPALGALACVAAALAGACDGGGGPPPALPFQVERPAATFTHERICALVDDGGNGAHIRGQDGGTTNLVDGRVFWTFGDTILDDGGLRPNNIAVSADLDASDCIELRHKTDAGGVAAPLLTQARNELTVWPAAGHVSVRPGVVHFLYNSVSEADFTTGQYRFNGVGLGRFDTETLQSERVLNYLVTQTEMTGQPFSLTPAVDMLVDEGYVYVYFSVLWNVRVGRVPAGRIEEREAYEWWDGASWQASAARSTDILRTAGGQQAFNVDWNPAVGRWTAVYSTNTLSAVAMAFADVPWGPFEDEVILFDCPPLFASGDVPGPPPVFPALDTSYFCYHATQHPELDRDERQTIYLTYGNLASYRLFLHRLTLGLPVYQYAADGAASYGHTAAAPAGATKDGVAFYVPAHPGGGLAAVHAWRDAATGDRRYETDSPGAAYADEGVAFYAAPEPAETLAPVYRWTRGPDGLPSAVYSTFDLADRGYERATAPSFYAATLPQAPEIAPDGYVYWVHVAGEPDFGCCDSTNNPTRQTTAREFEFTLHNEPSAAGYIGVVCAPVCGTGGSVVWSGRVQFSPPARGGKLLLTPDGPRAP